MSVATNLIRVTRPLPSVSSDITVIAYYHDPFSGVNGLLHAYEYDVDGNVVGDPMQVNLPTTGDFTDYEFSELVMRIGDLIYDGSPAILIEESARGSVWIWRPKSGSLDGHIWYNTSPAESKHVYVGGSIYGVRNSSGVGELLRFNLDLSLDEIVSQHTSTVTLSHIFCSSRSLCAGSPSASSFVRFPFDGSIPHLVTVTATSEPTQSGVPYSLSQSIVPDTFDTRFPRLVNDDTPGVTHLWPNEAPWLRLSSFSNQIRVQSADGHIIASEGERVVVGLDTADEDDEPIIDLLVPDQSGMNPFLIGIGNIP